MDPKCKICRRANEKLFLKGDKCTSSKCPLLKKPYPPGSGPKQRKGKRLSEYGKELREAKMLKSIYKIQDKQFKKMIRSVLERKGEEDVSTLLIKVLEKQLFNVIFRAGLAKSRSQAKKLVSHGHFIFKGRKIDIPSIKIKIGDEIKIKEKSKKNKYFQQIFLTLKKENTSSWLSLDNDKKIIKVIGEPEVSEAGIKVNVPLILAFYSR